MSTMSEKLKRLEARRNPPKCPTCQGELHNAICSFCDAMDKAGMDKEGGFWSQAAGTAGKLFGFGSKAAPMIEHAAPAFSRFENAASHVAPAFNRAENIASHVTPAFNQAENIASHAAPQAGRFTQGVNAVRGAFQPAYSRWSPAVADAAQAARSVGGTYSNAGFATSPVGRVVAPTWNAAKTVGRTGLGAGIGYLTAYQADPNGDALDWKRLGNAAVGGLMANKAPRDFMLRTPGLRSLAMSEMGGAAGGIAGDAIDFSNRVLGSPMGDTDFSKHLSRAGLVGGGLVGLGPRSWAGPAENVFRQAIRGSAANIPGMGEMSDFGRALTGTGQYKGQGFLQRMTGNDLGTTARRAMQGVSAAGAVGTAGVLADRGISSYVKNKTNEATKQMMVNLGLPPEIVDRNNYLNAVSEQLKSGNPEVVNQVVSQLDPAVVQQAVNPQTGQVDPNKLSQIVVTAQHRMMANDVLKIAANGLNVDPKTLHNVVGLLNPNTMGESANALMEAHPDAMKQTLWTIAKRMGVSVMDMINGGSSQLMDPVLNFFSPNGASSMSGWQKSLMLGGLVTMLGSALGGSGMGSIIGIGAMLLPLLPMLLHGLFGGEQPQGQEQAAPQGQAQVAP